MKKIYKYKNFIHKQLNKIFKENLIIKEILNDIIINNGIPYLVGGTVRDLFIYKFFKINNLNKIDFDIEAHNLSIEKLNLILKKYGNVNLIGKSFGIFKIDSINADFSLPRIDSCGRKPKVEFLNNININDSLKRRDIAINSIAIKINLKNNYFKNYYFEIFDPFNGIQDIKNRKINYIDENKFSEDPLRLFRVMRYANIFNFKIDNNLNLLCKRIDISSISKDRIYNEIQKTLLLAKKPGNAFLWLKKINKLNFIYSELNNLSNYKFKNFIKMLNNYLNLKIDSGERFFYIKCKIAFMNMKIYKEVFFNFSKKEYKKIEYFILKVKFFIKKIINKEKFKINDLKIYYLKLLAYELNKKNLKLKNIFNLLMNIYFKNEKIKKILFKIKNICIKEGIYENFIQPILNGNDLLKIIENKNNINIILQKIYNYQLLYDIKDANELNKILNNKYLNIKIRKNI